MPAKVAQMPDTNIRFRYYPVPTIMEYVQDNWPILAIVSINGFSLLAVFLLGR
jgi:hypothetical protein